MALRDAIVVFGTSTYCVFVSNAISEQVRPAGQKLLIQSLILLPKSKYVLIITQLISKQMDFN